MFCPEEKNLTLLYTLIRDVDEGKNASSQKIYVFIYIALSRIVNE
jgi:hypothetical protein